MKKLFFQAIVLILTLILLGGGISVAASSSKSQRIAKVSKTNQTLEKIKRSGKKYSSIPAKQSSRLSQNSQSQPVSPDSQATLGDNFSSFNSNNWSYRWGAIATENGELSLKSQPPTTISETHSALVTSKKAGSNYRFETDVATLDQLRQNNSPNTWEIAWVLFRFQDLTRYYYFILKPNGFELGKKHGSDGQIFLVTGENFKLELNKRYRWKILTKEANIQIFINEIKIIDYTDPDPILNGSIGLYEEDSLVQFDNVLLEDLP